MSVKGNQGKVEVVRGISLYTGIAPFKVMCVNPTKDQLAALGVNINKEPSPYLLENGQVRIDFWLTSVFDAKPFYTKLSFFVEKKQRTNKDNTKNEWINSFGQNCWSAINEPPQYEWFKKQGMRQAYVGESRLMDFIRAWVNAGEADEVCFDTWNDIFLGNMAELASTIKTFKDNVVRAMLYVREAEDGKCYQDVYGYKFSRWNITGDASWKAHFTKDENKPRGIWSYKVQEYKPTDPTPDAPEVATGSADAKWALGSS
jgi:hypothetical protein